MPTVGGLVVEISTNVAKLQSDMGRVRQSLSSVEATTRNLNKASQGVFEQLKSGWVGIASKIYLAEQALSFFNRTIGAVFIKGLKAVDDYKMGVASAAAVIMTFMEKQKGEDLGSQWKRASNYAEGIVPTLEKIAALTLLSGKETQMLFTEFAKGGVFLDATNEKAVKGFSAISNTIAIMTKGQDTERQILTEVRALMEGQAKAGSVLIKMLEAIDPKLKDHLKTWQAEGTTLEHLGVLLQGFDAASGQLQLTWQTIKSTLQTTVDQVLRGGMMNVYEELMQLALKLNTFLEEHKEIIQKGIYQGWIVVKSTIESIYKIYQEMKSILSTIGYIQSKIVEGWALLLTISPPIIDRLIAISKLMSMTWKATHGDIQGAKDAYSEYIKLQDKHILGGKTLGSEIEERVNKYYADIAKIGGGVIKPPKAMALKVEDGKDIKNKKKELDDWLLDEDMKMMKARETAEIWLVDRLNQLTLSEYNYKQVKLFEEYNQTSKVIGWTTDLYNAYKNESNKISNEETKHRIDNLRAIQDAEIQYHLAVIDLKEKEFKITGREAIKERLGLRNQELQNLQAQYNDLVGIKDKELERLNILNKIAEILGTINELILQQKEYSTAWEGIIEGLNEYFRNLQNEFEKTGKIAKDFATTTAQAMQDSFQDFFFDAMTGKLKTLQDYWRSFTNTVMQMLSQLMAKWVMMQAFGFLGGLGATAAPISLGTAVASGTMIIHQGGLVMHRGGIVDSIPKYHSGIDMASDERLAILQTGERVLSRNQNKQYEREQPPQQSQTVIVNMTVHATDADSFNSKIMQSKDAIAAAIMSAGINNHPMRRAR